MKRSHFPSHASHTLSSFPVSTGSRRLRLRTEVLMDTGVRRWKIRTQGVGVWARWHSRESNFQAMVMPPISESLKRSRKVPSGLLMSRSWACCLFTKPRMALGGWYIGRHGWVGRHHPQSLPHACSFRPPGVLLLTHHSNGAYDASSAPPSPRRTTARRYSSSRASSPVNPRTPHVTAAQKPQLHHACSQLLSRP